MIIVKLQGGLGNQMFQYAFGLAVSHKQNTELYLDGSFFATQKPASDIAIRQFDLGVFAGNVQLADNQTVSIFMKPGKLRKVLNQLNISKRNVYTEQSIKVDEAALYIPAPAYFDGYWQSERYFKGCEPQIRQSFTFSKPLNPRSQTLADDLTGKTETVSIHIRRGDYISYARTNQIHGTCSAAYYLNAIELLKSQLANPGFYVFADDPAWVKQQLMPDMDNATLVEHNQGNDSWQDMALMSMCNHHIIANSSFSWWGAWLNPHKDKIVIAPKDWFNLRDHYFDDTDIVPRGWIKLANG